MLVAPSPKFQLQDVGLPVDESVNWTAWPGAGAVGLNVKDAVRTEPCAMTTTWVALPDCEALAATSVTAYEPAVANAWLGFCAVLVEPSLKFQLQDVGVPVEESVNWTVWPAVGEEGL